MVLNYTYIADDIMKKGYYEPTPKKLRKLGDALLAISTFIIGFGIFEDIQWLSISSLLLGVGGKFLTNFFTDE